MSNNAPASPTFSEAQLGERFLSYADLEERYGKNRKTIWRWIQEGILPRPVQLDPRAVAFPLSEIVAAEQSRPRVAKAAAA